MDPMFTVEKSYEDGSAFFQIELENYFIDYVPRDPDTLFVVFDGSKPANKPEPWQRYPWGGEFLLRQGFSVIGVKAKNADWYRGEELHKFFRDAAFQELVSSHKRVFFYGTSMGGFAALVFSQIAPGCTVLSLNPQTTLDPAKVPWENRYPEGLAQDWGGDFADAADALGVQGRVYVVYDPLWEADKRHIKRLPQDKIVRLKIPFLQHDLAGHLSNMNLLKDIVLHLAAGDIEHWFPRALRARKDYALYKSNACFFRAYRLGWKHKFREAMEVLDLSLRYNPLNRHALQMKNRVQDILASGQF